MKQLNRGVFENVSNFKYYLYLYKRTYSTASWPNGWDASAAYVYVYVGLLMAKCFNTVKFNLNNNGGINWIVVYV